MYIFNSYRTVLFSEIESFSTQSNYKGGVIGNVWVITKTKSSHLFQYDESKFTDPDVAKIKVAEMIRLAIFKNEAIQFLY